MYIYISIYIYIYIYIYIERERDVYICVYVYIYIYIYIYPARGETQLGDTGLCERNTGGGDVWEDWFLGHQTRAFRALPAAGLQGNGLHRMMFFADTGSGSSRS